MDAQKNKDRILPMTRLVERVIKINARISPLTERKDRIDMQIAKLTQRSSELNAKIHNLSEEGAGIAGHLQYMEWGATQYRISKTLDGWNMIEFFNEYGERVRHPNDPMGAK